MKNELSISEIAKLAGVSATTVSRVFRKDAYVKEETRTAVLKAARENGYIPRQYKKRATTTLHDAVVGIVVPDIENAFF
ncbi:MAG: LacI family DNA-binding transcriptional regulator [Eubacteriales bacterium]|nr:LacI family DNA-binding transcriptional regulator [Eubacteriales bacterium]